MTYSSEFDTEDISIENIPKILHPDNSTEQPSQNRYNGIHAFVIVSESELALVKPDYTTDWADSNPEELKEYLFELGCDINKLIEIQEGLIHRNRMNKVVQCRRYACFERQDKDWLYSGYASREAINKASGNKLIRDMNRYAHLEA